MKSDETPKSEGGRVVSKGHWDLDKVLEQVQEIRTKTVPTAEDINFMADWVQELIQEYRLLAYVLTLETESK